MVSSIFEKMNIELSQRSFLGRIEDNLICFWDYLTFSKTATVCKMQYIWQLPKTKKDMNIIDLNFQVKKIII